LAKKVWRQFGTLDSEMSFEDETLIEVGEWAGRPIEGHCHV
jgi:hypothetical protein